MRIVGIKNERKPFQIAASQVETHHHRQRVGFELSAEFRSTIKKRYFTKDQTEGHLSLSYTFIRKLSTVSLWRNVLRKNGDHNICRCLVPFMPNNEKERQRGKKENKS